MVTRQKINEKAGVLRFEVLLGTEPVTAFISQATWRARHGQGQGQGQGGEGMLALYLQHQSSIDAMVIRKVSAGARRPVVLMAGDL